MMPALLQRAALLLLFVLLSLCPVVLSDLYMHNPHGSTNRLNENTADRANDNRLFDSQDNTRGGYPLPSNGRMYYYDGSILYIEWTAQHACGSNPTDSCQFILQYSCDNTNTMRDGQSTTTIPTAQGNGNAQCQAANCDTDPTYGRHESQAYYNASVSTFRNAGLFTADQQLNGQSQQFTRQNAGGARYGYENTEERDYYPWWGASPWKDIAVLTNTPSRCAAYRSESQNVKPRYYCSISSLTATQQQQQAAGQPYIPITNAGCITAGGVWTMVPAFNLPAPDCVATDAKSWSRDNHLGNPAGFSGFTYSYNWTVPNDYSESCVLRMRYNISTADFSLPNVTSTDPVDGGFAAADSIQAGVDYTYNAVTAGTVTSLPVWLAAGFPDQSQNPYVTSPTQYTRGFLYKGNPNNPNIGPYVDPFGPLVWSNSEIAAWQSSRQLPQRGALLAQQLAINTAQFSRTFQDRSFMFAIRQRPQALQGFNLYNINVRGKRGNIVQVYPSTEYDFVPDRLTVNVGDLVHFQWTGANTNPANDPQNANAPAGSDRSNVVVLGPAVWTESGQSSNPAFASTTGQWGRAQPCRIDDSVDCPFLGLDVMDLQRLAFDGINSSYFDLGPRQVTRAGIYHYVSTRNNNFSNRSQKGKLVVLQANSSSAAQQGSGASYQAVQWGMQCGQLMDGATVNAGQCTGQLVTSQDVYVQSAGTSGYDSEWYQLQPQQLTLSAPLIVTLPYRFLPLNSPQVYWKANATALQLSRVGGETQSGSSVSFAATQGGYFVVQNAVNAGEVAGIVLAALLVLGIVVFLYWKVRVQPLGGVEQWMRECCGSKKAKQGLSEQAADDLQSGEKRRLMTATPAAALER